MKIKLDQAQSRSKMLMRFMIDNPLTKSMKEEKFLWITMIQKLMINKNCLRNRKKCLEKIVNLYN